jgi:PadR family transcriptional regulator, regulatory protein PadR
VSTGNRDGKRDGCGALDDDDLICMIEEMSRETLGGFELMVMLALLRAGDEAYGVTISQALAENGGREAALGSVYAALDRLEAKGLVASELGDPTPERGGRAKRYFRATGKGVRQVRAARRTLVRLWSGIPALQGGRT